MKKFFDILLLAAVIVIAGGCSSGEGYFRAGYDFEQVDKIAIVDVVGDVAGEVAKNQIADFFAMELLRKGFAPVERAQVQSILKEQKFQASDLTSSAGVARAGEILNVPVVMVINVPQFDEEMNMTAKMLDVEDASVLWLGSGTGNVGSTLGTITGATVGAVAGAVVADNEPEAGAVVGGVLGGVAGQALSPQKAEVAREVAKKICRTLPERGMP